MTTSGGRKIKKVLHSVAVQWKISHTNHVAKFLAAVAVESFRQHETKIVCVTTDGEVIDTDETGLRLTPEWMLDSRTFKSSRLRFHFGEIRTVNRGSTGYGR